MRRGSLRGGHIKKIIQSVLILGFFFIFSKAKAGLVDPSLNGFIHGQNGAVVSVIALVAAPQNLNIPKPVRYQRASVVAYFKEVGRQIVLPVLNDIQNNKMPGVRVTGVYWINGSISAEVTISGLKALSEHSAISKIYRNTINGRDPVMGATEGRPPRLKDTVATEYNLTTIGLDHLYQDKPGIDGRGVVVGVVDTGVDASHPALQNKVVTFWNGNLHKPSPPQDFETHGTHVSGTIVGGNRTDNWIGVAPGAKLAVAGALTNYDTMAEGMQWFLDASTNPVAGKIKVINNSWNTDGAPDQEIFYRALSAWEAAGILPVFSAGNNGPKPKSITQPHEYPGTFAVAAYGKNFNVASFSSRGPGIFHGKETQKPDLTAPGVQINSSLPGGQYGRLDGTSMATPHVTGVVALLLQVNPNLNPPQLKDIILRTLKTPESLQRGGWSPDWGFGRLNAYDAVRVAMGFSSAESPMMNLGGNFFNTVESLDKMALARATLGEIGTGSDLYPATDTGVWLHSEDFN